MAKKENQRKPASMPGAAPFCPDKGIAEPLQNDKGTRKDLGKYPQINE